MESALVRKMLFSIPLSDACAFAVALINNSMRYAVYRHAYFTDRAKGAKKLKFNLIYLIKFGN
jgi:hypothetical protein